MKTRIFLMAFALVLSFTACKNTNKKQDDSSMDNSENTENVMKENENPDAAHNSENSLDWAGTYEGVIPCADCPGIEMKVTLNQDNTYKMSMDYMERDTKSTSKGDFEWNDEGSKITLFPEDGDASIQFQVGENRLYQLDANGNRVEGELADNYILEKK